jgi:acyl-CoA-binding protein
MTSAGFFHEDPLEEQFFIVSEEVKTSQSCAEASNEDRLRLYGLYKQVSSMRHAVMM